MSLRHTGRPKQLSIFVPKEVFWHKMCSRPNQSKFASAGGGIRICVGAGRQRLFIQVLQHHTVVSMSPTPAQRESADWFVGRQGTLLVLKYFWMTRMLTGGSIEFFLWYARHELCVAPRRQELVHRNSVAQTVTPFVHCQQIMISSAAGQVNIGRCKIS